MRRVNLMRMVSFITREQTLEINNIRSLFIAVHEKYLQLYPAWNLKATRRILIASYWFRHASIHFSVIMGIVLLVTIPRCNSWLTLFGAVLLASLPGLISLTAFIYAPSYFYNFLPKLEAILGEQEKLATQAEETKKCKRTQFQTPTLVIIHYVNSKIGNIPLLPANDPSAELLNKLYGSDKDKLKQNLSRLYRLSSLSVKERAEFLKGIENARDFFKELGCADASRILDDLDLKLHR